MTKIKASLPSAKYPQTRQIACETRSLAAHVSASDTSWTWR